MKQILVISGKGGTGKTVLTASLAALCGNSAKGGKVMADCDVDAADLHLILHPEVKERSIFQSGQSAVIDKNLCICCGKCINFCRFQAITRDFVVDGIDCEGCGLCKHICPVGAIRMEDNVSGEWFISETRYGPMVHAKLGIAEENSGKLVSLVRKQAEELASKKKCDYVIIDGPPGTGCPVIASLSSVDLAVIVTEPTLSGMHDMQRVLELTEHFKIKACVVINKFDLNTENTEEIRSLCEKKKVCVIGHIPFSKEVSQSVVSRKPLVEFTDGAVTQEIKSIWEEVKNCL